MSVARKTKTKKTMKKKTPVRGLHTTRFPGEKPAYRAARDTLLKEEVRLRRQIEAVAAMRRKLPLGGALKEDYVFETGGGAAVHFSELFADGKDTLLVYSFMFGPEMKSACSSCTSMLDGLEGQAPHVTQRANLVVVAKSPIERIKERWRWHLILKGPSRALGRWVRTAAPRLGVPRGGVRISVDRDPVSLM